MSYLSRLCAAGGFFDDRPLLRALFIWGHARAFCNHAMIFDRKEMARDEYKIMMEALADLPPVLLDGIPYDADYEYRLAAQAAWKLTGEGLPRLVRYLLGLPAGYAARPEFERRLIECRYLGNGHWPAVLKCLSFAKPTPRDSAELRFPPAADQNLKARLYVEMARCYEAKGLLPQALESWRFAAIASGIYVPEDQDLRADRQHGWADAKT